MKRLLKCAICVVMITLGSDSAFSQSNAQIERNILSHLRSLEKMSGTGGSGAKTLAKENLELQKELLKYGQRPSTLKYAFKALANKMFIATSKDGKFRIYSWDDQSGGTMRNFQNVFQYRAASGKVYSKVYPRSKELDLRGFSHQIFQFDTGRGRVYLANFTYILSTSLIRQELSVYGIDGDKLNSNLKLIKTRSGPHNSIGFEYDFFSVVNRPERPVTLIYFDDSAKSFRFPVVLEDKQFPNGGRVTNKFITYRFDGKYFVRSK